MWSNLGGKMKNKKLIIGSIVAALVLAIIAAVIIINPFSGERRIKTKVYMDASRDVEDRVEALLKQMTLDEKIGQMVQAENDDITLEEIKTYYIGSVFSGGDSDPKEGNSSEAWQSSVNEMKQAALETPLGIPLLYGVDAVHGHSNVEGATIFPHNIGLGATGDEDLLTRMGEVVAKEVKATGIQWTFAPTLADPQNEMWGRTYEGFSEDADLVSKLGTAFIEGLQGKLGTDDFLAGNHILGTAKHYIGEGYTLYGVNQGDVRMEEAEFEALLDDTLLKPYKAAVDAGVRTIMASYNSINGLKCHENSYLINDVLKGELGFTGLVVGDYKAVDQVSGATYKDKLVNVVNAGVDLLMEVDTWKEAIGLLKEAVEEGSISEDRIDDAVRRILRVKFEAGLFEEVVASDEENALMSEMGSDEHRELAREAVRKSLVLLKNDKVGGKTAMEALADSKNILVLGSKADDIGVQCGGWTITWQGSMGDITTGTTILEGFKDVAKDKKFTHNILAETTGKEDAIIVVSGEYPYAETNGDRNETNLLVSGSDEVLLGNAADAIEAARKKGVPVILVLMTGRPVEITDYVDQFDAIVEAWWPGTEGAGVADVFFGDYDFTGTLSYTWPKSAADIEGKLDEANADKVLFPYGTGLKKDGTNIK